MSHQDPLSDHSDCNDPLSKNSKKLLASHHHTENSKNLEIILGIAVGLIVIFIGVLGFWYYNIRWFLWLFSPLNSKKKQKKNQDCEKLTKENFKILDTLDF